MNRREIAGEIKRIYKILDRDYELPDDVVAYSKVGWLLADVLGNITQQVTGSEEEIGTVNLENGTWHGLVYDATIKERK